MVQLNSTGTVYGNSMLEAPVYIAWSILEMVCGDLMRMLLQSRTVSLISTVRHLIAVLKSPIKPHVIVETSPGHYQVWWRIEPIPVTDANRDHSSELFRKVQRGIADRFGGDRHVSGLCGVARIPGFLNMKGDPFLIRLVELNDLPEYPITALINAFEIDLKKERRASTIATVPELDLSEPILEGTRNQTLFDTLRNIAYKGMVGEDLFGIGFYINDEFCVPPLSDDHVRGIVSRINEFCLYQDETDQITTNMSSEFSRHSTWSFSRAIFLDLRRRPEASGFLISGLS